MSWKGYCSDRADYRHGRLSLQVSGKLPTLPPHFPISCCYNSTNKCHVRPSRYEVQVWQQVCTVTKTRHTAKTVKSRVTGYDFKAVLMLGLGKTITWLSVSNKLLLTWNGMLKQLQVLV